MRTTHLLFSLAIAIAACSRSEPSGTPAASSKPAVSSTPAASSPPGATITPGTPGAHATATVVAGKDPQKARELIAQGAVVLDVRTPDEFGGGHLASATNVPIDTFGDHLADVDKLAAGDKAKPIVVYCAKGGRAARAKHALEAAGYTNVVNGGGYDDLK